MKMFSNKYPADCHNCGVPVQPKKGWTFRGDGGQWLTACADHKPEGQDVTKRPQKAVTPPGGVKAVKATARPARPQSNGGGLLDDLRRRGHLTNIQGSDFVLLGGLLELAHEHGLESIETEMLSMDWDHGTAVFKATAKGARGTFAGHGDAAPGSLSHQMLPSFIRMAETRAIARSLRNYLGIGMTCSNELPSNAGDKGDKGDK